MAPALCLCWSWAFFTWLAQTLENMGHSASFSRGPRRCRLIERSNHLACPFFKILSKVRVQITDFAVRNPWDTCQAQ
jgi:hypothetical protein